MTYFFSNLRRVRLLQTEELFIPVLLPFQKRKGGQRERKKFSHEWPFICEHFFQSITDVFTFSNSLSLRCKKKKRKKEKKYCKISIIQLWRGATFDRSDTSRIGFESSGSSRTAISKAQAVKLTEVRDIKNVTCVPVFCFFCQQSRVLLLFCCILSGWYREKRLCSAKWLRKSSTSPLRVAHSGATARHVYWFTKSSTMLILALAARTANYSLTYCSPEWVEKRMWNQTPRVSPLSSYSVFFSSCATQNFCVLCFSGEQRVFWVLLSRVPLSPLVHWAF